MQAKLYWKELLIFGQILKIEKYVKEFLNSRRGVTWLQISLCTRIWICYNSHSVNKYAEAGTAPVGHMVDDPPPNKYYSNKKKINKTI